ncbi:MAG: hypothetical protein B5M48_04200 [Candidatus Omnitrophica bacterium 4484_213]|nr:MAG: hypothetical protein B5M48_04200 [Candidatus Omnitrophica bacterium 4484_213]
MRFVDTLSFASGLKNALRQDPDVILVGEMQDVKTIQTALVAAETGHLILNKFVFNCPIVCKVLLHSHYYLQNTEQS